MCTAIHFIIVCHLALRIKEQKLSISNYSVACHFIEISKESHSVIFKEFGGRNAEKIILGGYA
jgi:hypothetical protein